MMVGGFVWEKMTVNVIRFKIILYKSLKTDGDYYRFLLAIWQNYYFDEKWWTDELVGIDYRISFVEWNIEFI